MPSGTPRILSSGIGDAVLNAAREARERLVVVAPYITRPALQRSIAAVPRSVRVVVITQWSVEAVARGSSDPGILDDLAVFPNHRVLLHEKLHAKLLVGDDAVAIVGSANLTDAGLGFSPDCNIEIIAELRPAPTAVLAFVRFLEKVSVTATPELRATVEAAAASLQTPRMPQLAEVVPQARTPDATVIWDLSEFPSYRHPESLYQRYLDLKSCLTEDERETVLEDLAALQVPDGLTEGEFIRVVAGRLLERADLRALDEFVAVPRRFGEMSGWLKKHAPSLAGSHKTAQRRLQTIIRWLRVFLPERYALRQPGYAEIFGHKSQDPEP